MQLKKALMLSALALLGPAAAAADQVAPSFLDLGAMDLAVRDVEVVDAIKSPLGSLGAAPGYKLVVFHLEGSTAKSGEVFVSTDGFRVVYDGDPQSSSGGFAARQSHAVALDHGPWVIPPAGQWGLVSRKLSAGTVELRVGIVLPEAAIQAEIEVPVRIRGPKRVPSTPFGVGRAS